MRLLYVEDEIDILESTGRRLGKEGYSVDLCADGSEAISYIDMADYDVIILDVMLPGKSGIEILQYIRSKGLTNRSFCSLPAIPLKIVLGCRLR